MSKSKMPVRPRSHYRRMFAVGVAVATAASLSACGGNSDPTGGAGGGAGGSATSTPSAAGSVPAGTAGFPSYYPADYSKIVDAAKDEGGTLNIYSNTDQENWAPVFKAFQARYPFVTKIAANNLDSDEVFQRELAETATGKAPADLLVSNAAQAWAKYADGKNRLAAYVSPEVSKLPAFVTLLPNVYAFSADPLAIAYNTALVNPAPTGIASLAKMVAADPGKFKNKLTARDVKGAFGFTISRAFTEANPNSWTDLKTVLGVARPETSSGTQMEKILAGEYLAGFFISAAPAYPVVNKSNGLVQIVFPDDGTVVLPRGIGIAPAAPHMNTAKLFEDFLLSTNGQEAVAKGGLTSLRPDVKPGNGLHTYQEVIDKVGQSKITLAKYALVSDADVKTFTDRWNGLLGSSK